MLSPRIMLVLHVAVKPYSVCGLEIQESKSTMLVYKINTPKIKINKLSLVTFYFGELFSLIYLSNNKYISLNHKIFYI